ncbi:MAG: IgGFc-binding protein [Deltaproteobacteria bacterium]|nr:IgGFc-binding protein [Deltaproteobacteria bacterium]
MVYRFALLLILAFLLAVALAGCSDSRASGGGDDSGGDTDTDSDTDADSDSDSDCTEGEFFCVGNDVYECTGPEGESEYVETCDNPYECVDGECVYGGDINAIPETCGEAELGHTSVGCLFYAIDSDLVVSYDLDQYAIFVSNVQLSSSATVVVEQRVGSVWEPAPSGGPVTIDPMSLYVFLVPDKHVNGSGYHHGGAYRITSDVPIVAYQVNPYEADESYTSDATLLHQVPAWDSIHYVFGAEKINDSQDVYATVIASEDGTVVEVTPSVSTASAVDIPAGSPGVPFSIAMNTGDVAQFEVSISNQSLTGTKITSDEDHPIAVFSGNTCALIPLASGACDHLHEQLTGVQKWGRDFVAARMPVRSTEMPIEPSLWQIVASQDDTTIEFTASSLVTGLPSGAVTLNEGEVWEEFVAGTLDDPGDFYISADKPIGVCNYMTGSSTVVPNTPEDPGDPSQVQISPVEQYLERYVLLVPEHWLYDVVTVVRPTGVEVEVDAVAIDAAEFTPVGSDHEVARVLVEDGVHTFAADQGISVIVVGYDDDDSYAYLGGTGTAIINPIE